MSYFLYISDVFCPWCYGFAPIMRRLAAEYPGLPMRVLGGTLVEEPTTLDEMAKNHPTLRACFERLASTTGQAVGEAFLKRLEAGKGGLRMHSPEMAVPLAALKDAAPERALELMEAFQTAFYKDGRDVLDPAVQRDVAEGVAPGLFDRAARDPAAPERAERESAEALDLMGEFVVYPTLWLVEDGGERRLLSRGYSAYETVAARLAAGAGAAVPASAEACGLDGTCPL